MFQNSIRFSFIMLLGFFISCQSEKAETSQSDDTQTVDTKSEYVYEQPDWVKNAVIYEVNVRQFSEEGNFAGVTAELERIKNLGVDIVWLMPIHPIGELNRKGSLGSYYAVQDYKAVNPEFGNMDDFRELVNKAHDLDMKVILDWVANHSSPDNIWIEDNLDFYTKDSLGNAPIPTIGTDWYDVADLNFDNKEMREAMLDAMLFWVKEFDIDGYRCDVAEMVPMDFWIDTRQKLDEIKPIFMLAEGAEPELHKAFNMTYGWPLKDIMVDISDENKNFNAVHQYIEERNENYNPQDIIMYFTTNHDENSWNYLEKEKFGENLKNFNALTFVMGGMPLIYSGQESGFNKQLAFFEKDPIEWGNYEYADYFKQLVDVYKNNAVLWNQGERANYEIIDNENDALFFIMKKDGNSLGVFQNYSNETKLVPSATLDGFDANVDLISGQSTIITGDGLEIPAHTSIIIGQ